jgi:hypothetical protein
MDALIHQHTIIVLNAFFGGMDSQPNFICFRNHVFPGSRSIGKDFYGVMQEKN